MKVIVTYGDPDDYGVGESLEIKTPKYTLGFGYMEPEDANLSRDLSCVYSIEHIIQEAYEAGKNGEPLEWETIELDNDGEIKLTKKD